MPEPTDLHDSLAWLGTDDCPCDHEWKSLGRLYGVSMGHGWVRVTTHPDCRHHTEEANR